jgi:uncharacterized LabA/DUF88 family protein
MSSYLFVDGEYLRKAFETSMKRFFVTAPPMDYRPLMALGASYQRGFYYDAIDYEPRSGETADQTKARIAERVQLHQHINSIPNFHVREGYVSTGRKPSKRQQKAVDVQLAVDALENAAVKNMAYAALLLGDLDFQPLVVALTRFGVRVTILYEHSTASEPLLEVADQRRSLTLADYQTLCTPSFKDTNTFPTFNEGGISTYPDLMKTGTWNGRTAQLFGHAGGTPPYQLFVTAGDEAREKNLIVYYSGTDSNKPEVALELAYGGKVIWS